MAVVIGICLVVPWYKAAGRSLPAFEGRRGVGGIPAFSFPRLDPKNKALFVREPYYPGWNEVMPSNRLREIRQAGFDFLRLNIDPGPMFQANEKELRSLVEKIEVAINSILAADLRVLIDIQVSGAPPKWSYSSVTADINGRPFNRYLAVVSALAALSSKFDPKSVALEVFNEPPPPCVWKNRTPWPKQLEIIYKVARQGAPRVTLFLSGACWASRYGLFDLDPSQFDKNTIFVFHFYDPFVFTHQGYWGSAKVLEYLPRLPYPPDRSRIDQLIAHAAAAVESDKALNLLERITLKSKVEKTIRSYLSKPYGPTWIDKQFAEVRGWAASHKVSPRRISLDEFGAMKDVYGKKGAAPEDRYRWMRDVRTSAEKSGFSWSVWALTNSMGLTLGDTGGPLDPQAIIALGLKARQ